MNGMTNYNLFKIEVSGIFSVLIFYGSAFRRRRHYVIELSVRLSVRPFQAWNTLFPPVQGSVGPSDQPWLFSACPSVHLSVRPDRFPGISRKMHGGNGLKLCMLMFRDHLQNWLDFGRALLIFLMMVPLWLSETGHIWGHQALSGERLGVNDEGESGVIFTTLCVEFCLVLYATAVGNYHYQFVNTPL